MRNIAMRLGLLGVIGVGALVARPFLSGNVGDLKVGDCFDEPTIGQTVDDVQHHLPNRHTNPRRLRRSPPTKHTKRQVLYGKIALWGVRAGDPAGAIRIVRFVQNTGHFSGVGLRRWKN